MRDELIVTPTPPKRMPWNKGKLTGPKPPLRPPGRAAIASPASAIAPGRLEHRTSSGPVRTPRRATSGSRKRPTVGSKRE